MKTKAELIERRKTLATEMGEIVSSGKAEKRKLSAAETKAFEAAKKEISEIDEELRKLDEKPPTPRIIMKDKAEAKDFSLVKALRSLAFGEEFDASTKVFIEEGKRQMKEAGQGVTGKLILPFEHRATIQATAAASGQEAISEEKLEMIGPLRDALVLAQAGATMMTGLKGDGSIPIYAGATALWKGEGVASADGAGATSEIIIAPKRITTYINISNRLLMQDTTGAEALIKMDMAEAIAGKLESTILGKENISADQPLGLFFAAPTVKGAATWANIVALETAVNVANGLKARKYITNPNGIGILKTTNKVANQNGYILDPDGKLNGYECLVSGHVAKQLQAGQDEFGIIFANWAELLIAQWGAMDIKVDTVTRLAEDETRFVINSYWDATFRRANMYKTGSIK